jgi:hypothetical protein
MKQTAFAALGMLAASAAFAQAPSIDDIMARVAANQEKSVAARTQFVYRQEELFALRRGNGSTECQGKREYTVTPGPRGAVRQAVKSEDSSNEHCSLNFTSDSGKSVSVGTDGASTEGLSSPMGPSKDGIPRELFPLTAKQQHQYVYKLVGTETVHGRPSYRVSFHPNHHRDDDGAEGYWKGEALIDAAEFQPVLVTTDLTAKVPMAVRVLLGTNVKGVGFSVSYQRVADGVWFPAGFGGEFKLNVLFFYRRSISINVKNSDFKRTDVNSNVAFDKIQ